MAFSHESRAMRPAPVPVKEPKPLKKRVPAPFDPEDLSRRLRIVQAEQEVKAHGKRRAKVDTKSAKTAPRLRNPRDNNGFQDSTQTSESEETDKINFSSGSTAATTETDPDWRGQHGTGKSRRKGTSATSGEADCDGELSSKYRHIPQVAASQFTRTTTTDNPEERVVHKLSRMAMGFHMDGVNADHEVPAESSNAAPREKAMALRDAQIEREKQYERNQFQHPSTRASATATDRKPSRVSHRHTFETHAWTKGSSNDEAAVAKRMSADSAIQVRMSLEKLISAFEQDRRECMPDSGLTGSEIAEHRVDWTQSDENKPHPDSQRLRKADSKWSLRGRFGGQKHNASSNQASPGRDLPVKKSPISPIAQFFSRRRH